MIKNSFSNAEEFVNWALSEFNRHFIFIGFNNFAPKVVFSNVNKPKETNLFDNTLSYSIQITSLVKQCNCRIESNITCIQYRRYLLVFVQAK